MKEDRKEVRKKILRKMSQVCFLLIALLVLAVAILSPSQWTGLVMETFSNFLAVDTGLTDEIIMNCSNSSNASKLDEINCINNEFGAYFIYKGDKEFKIDKILEEGGDCVSATRWYLYVFDKLNIPAQPIIIYPEEDNIFDYFSNTTAHAFVFANFEDIDGLEYRCLVDQGEIWCVRGI